MWYIAIGAAYGASDVRIQREAAHARSVQHGARLNDFERNGVLWFAWMTHMKITHMKIIGAKTAISNQIIKFNVRGRCADTSGVSLRRVGEAFLKFEISDLKFALSGFRFRRRKLERKDSVQAVTVFNHKSEIFARCLD